MNVLRDTEGSQSPVPPKPQRGATTFARQKKNKRDFQNIPHARLTLSHRGIGIHARQPTGPLERVSPLR